MQLQLNSDGIAVSNLQKNLNQVMSANLAVDGVFGPLTLAALENFQATHKLKADGIFGPLTQSALVQALVGQIPVDPSEPMPWMAWMRAHVGEAEITGAPATDFDNEIFSHTDYGSLQGTEVAGCAATACAALEETGYLSPHDASAESFRNYGTPCSLQPGAVVGFNWEGQKGVHANHVAFCDHIVDGNLMAALGGNQDHYLNVEVFDQKYIDFVRWPVKAKAK